MYMSIYIYTVSILGILVMALGIYSAFGYLDPWGVCLDSMAKLAGLQL